jgi:hypothetical protein
MKQDPTHPTGVAETSSSLQVETVAARERKADAAVDMYLEKNKTLKVICRKLGYPSESAEMRAIELRLIEHSRNNPKTQASVREMIGRRLERLARSVASKAYDENDPEHLNAVTVLRGILTDQAKLYGATAPQQLVVTNPTTEAIEAIAHQIMSHGAVAAIEGDIFSDDADDEEVLALERRRADTENDIVDAEIVEDEATQHVKELDVY